MQKKQKQQKQRPVSSKKNPAKPAIDKRKYFIPLFIIILISFITFLPILHNGFVNFDDDWYLLNNKGLASINPLENFSQFFMGNYHPLTMLVYSIEYQFFGLNAPGYHTVSLLLHLLNTILVFFVILKLSNKKEVALLTSLLFGIHPMHVESVAWASELKDLLYSVFFLASWLCYLHFVEKSRWKYYWYCILFFLLSLFSKAMAVSLPLVLLLTDYFKGRKFQAKVWIEKVPYFMLSLIFGVVAIFAQKAGDAIHDIDNYPLYQRFVFASYGFVTYLVKMLIPYHLSAFYPYPVKNGVAIPAWYYIYPVLFLIIAACVFYSLRFSKKILFGTAFFAITVFFVLQLLPVGNAIMADRYSYIPSIGIFYLAGEGFYRLWGKKYPAINFKLPIAIIVSAIVIFFSVQTYTRCAVWENSMNLWNDVISKYKTIPVAYNNRGTLFKDENKIQEALDDYNKAIELAPTYALAYNNRGLLLADENRNEEAIGDYAKAIELRPDFAEAYNNRGSLQINNKKYPEALADYDKAIELHPGYAEAYQNRGFLLAGQNRYAEALKDYNKAIELNPAFTEAYNNLGNLFLNEQKYDQALLNFNKAIELQPTYAKAYNGLGVLLMRQEKYEQAIKAYYKAIELQPDYNKVYYNIALCEYNLGRTSDACQSLQKAISLGLQEANDTYNQICR